MKVAIRMLYEAVLIITFAYVVFSGAQLLIVQQCGRNGFFNYGYLVFNCEVRHEKYRGANKNPVGCAAVSAGASKGKRVLANKRRDP